MSKSQTTDTGDADAETRRALGGYRLRRNLVSTAIYGLACLFLVGHRVVSGGASTSDVVIFVLLALIVLSSFIIPATTISRVGIRAGFTRVPWTDVIEVGSDGPAVFVRRSNGKPLELSGVPTDRIPGIWYLAAPGVTRWAAAHPAPHPSADDEMSDGRGDAP